MASSLPPDNDSVAGSSDGEGFGCFVQPSGDERESRSRRVGLEKRKEKGRVETRRAARKIQIGGGRGAFV